MKNKTQTGFTLYELLTTMLTLELLPGEKRGVASQVADHDLRQR